VCRIGKREARDLTRCVIPRQHLIANTGPAVVPGVVARGKAAREVAPPGDRVGGERLELDDMSRRTRTVPGNAEGHLGAAAVLGQREARLVELKPLECVGGAPVGLAHPRARPDH
jgi:hypothetical protein